MGWVNVGGRGAGAPKRTQRLAAAGGLPSSVDNGYKSLRLKFHTANTSATIA